MVVGFEETSWRLGLGSISPILWAILSTSAAGHGILLLTATRTRTSDSRQGQAWDGWWKAFGKMSGMTRAPTAAGSRERRRSFAISSPQTARVGSRSKPGGIICMSRVCLVYVSLACPWAHRSLIFRKLLGLETAFSVSVVDALMLEHGWTLAPGADPLNGFRFLHQAYTTARSDFTGRVTVPVLWDKVRSKRFAPETRGGPPGPGLAGEGRGCAAHCRRRRRRG